MFFRADETVVVVALSDKGLTDKNKQEKMYFPVSICQHAANRILATGMHGNAN